MSGLNDSIETDIEQELNGQDRLEVTPDQFTDKKDSEQQSNTAPSIILKVGDDQQDDQGNPVKPTIDELFGEDTLPNELPNINAKIIMIAQKQNSIDDATSTLHGIKQSGFISQEDIIEINSVLPGYLNEKEKIEYYTKTPTLTRYTTAVNTIGFKILDQKKEQADLTLSTFRTLKDSVIITQKNLKQTLLDTHEDRKQKLTKLMGFIEENMYDQDVSGYHGVIQKLLESSLEEDVPHSVRNLPVLLEKALLITRRPNAFTTFLNKSIFLKETMDQDFVFYSLNSQDNLSERILRANLKELIYYTYSQEKLELLQRLEDILVSAVKYIDNCLFAIDNKDAVDAGKEPEPFKILKRESETLTSINGLINTIIQFDKTILDVVYEFANIIESIP